MRDHCYTYSERTDFLATFRFSPRPFHDFNSTLQFSKVLVDPATELSRFYRLQAIRWTTQTGSGRRETVLTVDGGGYS